MHIDKFDYIKEILIGIKTKVDIDSSLKQYDINIKSEVLFMHILNDVYGWKLEDANELKDNFKAIDLIDHDKEYVIQVTSNIKPQKVYDTINGFQEFDKDDFYRQYSNYKLKMFFIDVNVSFSETILKKFQKSELKEEDLINITHILEKIKNPDICDKLYTTLKKLFDSNSHTKKSPTNIEGNVTGVGNNNGTVHQTITNNFYNATTLKEETVEELRIKYKNNVDSLRKTIFTYYSSYGTNFNKFRRASTFDELYDILKNERDCLYCIFKEIGKEVDEASIDCEALKSESESSREINKIILIINSNTNSLKDCQITGYVGFSSESLEAIEEDNNRREFTDGNHSQILSKYMDSLIQGRSCARIIELQLFLPNQFFKLDFKIEDKRIRVIKRLRRRIDTIIINDNNDDKKKLSEEIKFWKKNSDFYHDCKSKKICEDSICSLDKHDLSDFREDENIDDHICVISDECLSHNIDDIYSYGITIVLYPYNNSCKIINTIDFKSKPIENIKSLMFKFMKSNQGVHLIYDDYNDLDFFKNESKVKGTKDDYL